MKDTFSKYQAAAVSRKKIHKGNPGTGEEPKSYKRRRRARAVPYYIKARMK